MTWKRLGVVGCLLALLGALPPLRAAEEEPPPPEAQPGTEEPKKEEEAPQAPAETQKKVHWWGDRFALYVEASLGSSSFDDVRSSIETRPGAFSENTLSLDDNAYGNVTVGWMFPFNRGKFLVSWTGYKEDSFTFRAQGLLNQVANDTTPASGLLGWWDMNIQGGRLDAVRTPPTWDSLLDDKNNNNKPDPEEVQYGAADLTVLRGAPENLQNRLQTLDLLYQRDFGGRRVSGRWTGGLRHFRYEGSVPAAAWVLVDAGAGEGWTEGVLNRVLVFSQDTSGTGPTGSLQVAAHFFRRRLTIYGRGRVAFLLESVETDSGGFNTLVRDTTNTVLFAAPARLQKSLDKSVWHVGAEIGMDLELAKGLQLMVAYNRTGYLDAILLPTHISIPDTLQRAPQGTVGLFTTRDILTDAWRAGFGYQF